MEFLLGNLHCTGDQCLIWPLFRADNGYGRTHYNGKITYAHRVMCILAKGPPPTDTHEAAHSCGNGKGGCVHPQHLSWKTPSENQLERRQHGTHGRGGFGAPRWVLTEEQVAQIRALKDQKTQRELAVMFGTSWQNIGMILRGETWKTGKRDAGIDARAKRAGRLTGSLLS